jgi:dihydroorotate dehydrogenase
MRVEAAAKIRYGRGGMFGTSRDDFLQLIRDLAQRLSAAKLAQELGVSTAELENPKEWTDQGLQWRAVRAAYKHGFFDLLPAHGVQPISYDIRTPFDLVSPPVGFDLDAPLLPLRELRKQIAGHWVDFPLGLPASVLAANAKWIEFYARRGFDILTYKTVRTVYRDVHPWPNWVFLDDPPEDLPPAGGKVVGYPDYWPEELSTVSMANSFGVPSFAPEWWQEDVKRARSVVREGHQVFIVSVMASKNTTRDSIRDDFVEAALMAKRAGADIVEANYSCPNVPDDPVGEVYQDAKFAAEISGAIKKELGETPLFVKIGYLEEARLRDFLGHNGKWIDGIVAINTISAEVVDRDGKQTFPNRKTAGVSGWAIKKKAQEVARNLVELRPHIAKELGKSLTIIGLGGVISAQDVSDYLKIGVDAVESCTGAFLNPNLGLDVRRDEQAEKMKPSILGFGLELAGKVLKDIVLHPLSSSRIRIDRQTRRVAVEPR